MRADVGAQFTRLVQIMVRLRGPGGCPWDREQDLRSLRPFLVEETYEVLDEMDRVAAGGPWRSLCEELGDLLFQIVFHSQLASELQEFDVADVCQAIADKLESRHPHVFADAKATTASQVVANWERLKVAEKRKKAGREVSVLEGVPSSAPALLRAERLTDKAARVGFDWPDLPSVREKVDEELRELDEAIASKDRAQIDHELGDVLFALANLARFTRTPPEDALRAALARFTHRFHQVEAALAADRVPLGQATLAQMDQHWEQAKRVEKALPPPASPARAALQALRLPTSSVPEAARFWTLVAPLLRWERCPSGPEAVVFTDGSVRYEFVAAEPRGAAWQLGLSAPSRAMVELLHQVLSDRAPDRLVSPPSDTESGYGLVFTSPGGPSWRYGYP